MCDERIRVAVLVCVNDHARRLIRQQDVLVLIHNAHARLGNTAEGFFLLGRVKVFVVEVKLYGIALSELVGSFSALVIDLNAL